jgi:hypothetical protein
MQNENKLVISMGFGVFWAVLASTTVYAADSIEGYWKSIDDRTGEPLSIIEFKRKLMELILEQLFIVTPTLAV